MGKGSKERPLGVSREDFNDNWDKIFKKKTDPMGSPDDGVAEALDELAKDFPETMESLEDKEK